MQWEGFHYVVIERDRLDDLAALAADDDASARVLEAISEWDTAAGRCINCKAAPLPLPEAFIVVLKDNDIKGNDKTLIAGICERCGTDKSNLMALARAHMKRAYPTMQILGRVLINRDCFGNLTSSPASKRACATRL